MIFHHNASNFFHVNYYINIQKKWKLRDLFQKSNQRCDLYKITIIQIFTWNVMRYDLLIIIIIYMRDFDLFKSNVKCENTALQIIVNLTKPSQFSSLCFKNRFLLFPKWFFSHPLIRFFARILRCSERIKKDSEGWK